MSERLERVEAILEVLAQQTLANAQATARNTEAIERLFAATAQNTEAIGQAFAAIGQNAEAIGRVSTVTVQNTEKGPAPCRNRLPAPVLPPTARQSFWPYSPFPASWC